MYDNRNYCNHFDKVSNVLYNKDDIDSWGVN